MEKIEKNVLPSEMKKTSIGTEMEEHLKIIRKVKSELINPEMVS